MPDMNQESFDCKRVWSSASVDNPCDDIGNIQKLMRSIRNSATFSKAGHCKMQKQTKMNA